MMSEQEKKAQLEVIAKIKTKIAELKLESSSKTEPKIFTSLSRLSNYIETITPK